MFILFYHQGLGLGLWCLKATFNNNSAISSQSVLLVEETEKTTDLSQVTDKLDQFVRHPCLGFPPTVSLVAIIYMENNSLTVAINITTLKL